MLKARHFLAAGVAAAFFGSLQLGAVYGAITPISPTGLQPSDTNPAIVVTKVVTGMAILGLFGTFYAIVPCLIFSLLFGPVVRAQYRSAGVGQPTGYLATLAISLVAYGVAGAVLGKAAAFFGMFAAGVVIYPVTGLLALNLMARGRYPPFTDIPAEPV